MSCPHSENTPRPMDSIEALIRHMAACGFPQADIISIAKRLQDMSAASPVANTDDRAALKVEKNALALVFIPAVVTLANDFISNHPHQCFAALRNQLETIPLDHVRAGLPLSFRHAAVCHAVSVSLGSLFAYLARIYVVSVVDAAANGDSRMEWTLENLLIRYNQALSNYHALTHTITKVSRQHFNPHGHLSAGINTALFFILRMLSAMCVLGERQLGRPVTRAELSAGVKRTTPLLLAIARCHLEQLLLLEEPSRLNKEAGFMIELSEADYADQLAKMFLVTVDGSGLRLEIHPSILKELPVVGGSLPRTGCPALYAAAPGSANAIVAMIRLTERSFADILWGATGSPSQASGTIPLDKAVLPA